MTETKDKANSCKSRWKFFLTKSADLLHIYPDPLWDHLTEVVHEYSTYCFQVTFCHHQLPLGLLFNCKTYFCKKKLKPGKTHISTTQAATAMTQLLAGRAPQTWLYMIDVGQWKQKRGFFAKPVCEFFSSRARWSVRTRHAYCCNLNDFEVVFLLGLRVLLYWTTRRTISETMYALLHLKVISQRKKWLCSVLPLKYKCKNLTV